ncbi:MAG: prepilin-type N-terminal cleavage/methylation domain-containing protein [Gemmatimonadetes bacterium]|nr:prepilin-type N-terminal cleavage/methylation domain-containing protein [Gemmatimonadota bacterium]
MTGRRDFIAHHTRRGFTLVELMVALTLLGVIAVTARALATSLFDTGRAIADVRMRRDGTSAQSLLLARLVRNMERASDSAVAFVGDPTGATFRSTCPTSHGTWEGCIVRLTAGMPLRVSIPGLEFRLGDPGEDIQLSYLGEGLGTLTWVSVWLMRHEVPHAIGLVRARSTHPDTVALPVGVHR